MNSVNTTSAVLHVLVHVSAVLLEIFMLKSPPAKRQPVRQISLRTISHLTQADAW